MHTTLFEFLQVLWNRVNTLAISMVAMAVLVYAVFAGYQWLALGLLLFVLSERLLVQLVVYFMSISLREISIQLTEMYRQDKHGPPPIFDNEKQ